MAFHLNRNICVNHEIIYNCLFFKSPWSGLYGRPILVDSIQETAADWRLKSELWTELFGTEKCNCNLMCSLLSALLYRLWKHQVRGYDRKCPSLWRFWSWQHLVARDRNLILTSASFIAEIGNMSASRALYMSMSTVLSFDIDGNQTSGRTTTALLMHLTSHLSCSSLNKLIHKRTLRPSLAICNINIFE